MTLALISSPSPFYLRCPQRRADTHSLHICSCSGLSRSIHCRWGCCGLWPKPPSTTSVACRCAPWLDSNPGLLHEHAQKKEAGALGHSATSMLVVFLVQEQKRKYNKELEKFTQLLEKSLNVKHNKATDSQIIEVNWTVFVVVSNLILLVLLTCLGLMTYRLLVRGKVGEFSKSHSYLGSP